MSKTKNIKKICSKCSVSKTTDRDFYLASNNLISEDGRLSICKTCMASLVDMDNPHSLIEVMRAVDRPFLKPTYDGALEKPNPFGEYMRMLVTPQNREKTYLDSEFSKSLEKYSNKKDLQEFNQGIEIVDGEITEDSIKNLRKKWGKFDSIDYEFLEEFYKEYSHTYSTDTPVQIMLYRNIAKVHLQAEKELSEGNVKQYKELMELSSKLHADGHIKPMQNSGQNDDRGLSTYGLWIKEVEKEEPCEFFEERKLYEDYDSFKMYWEKWFVRPFKNIFNVSKDFDVGDDK